MAKEDLADAIRSFSKDVLVDFILQDFGFRNREGQTLRRLRLIEWEQVSSKAIQLMDESIEVGKGAKVGSPRWNESQRLWKKSEQLDRKAKRLYKRIGGRGGAE